MKETIKVTWRRHRDTQGICLHQNYVAFFEDGSHVKVHSSEGIVGNKWYLTDEECKEMMWYATKEDAVKHYIANGYKVPTTRR